MLIGIISYIVSISYFISFLKNGNETYLYVGAIFFATGAIRCGFNDIVLELIKWRKDDKNTNNANHYISYKRPYNEDNKPSS